MPEPLPAKQAFAFSAYLKDHDRLILEWKIAPTYYLYQDQLHIQVEPLPKTDWQVTLPHGKEKSDAIRGHYRIYTGTLKIPVHFKTSLQQLTFTIHYQGCSAQGFCYSPTTQTLNVDLNKISIGENVVQTVVAKTPATPLSEQDYATAVFAGKSIWIITLTFLGFGLLLAFTPCVLPMVPILSGIIIGHHKKRGTMRAFSLSLAYVLGMALTYAVAGMIVALLGNHIQSALQRPWVIVIFSAIFVLMALSLFGVYQMQLPARLQQRLTAWSNRQKGGTYIGVFFMGSISSLIVSPCISPPLVGVLAYIAQTGNMGLGGLALLALGIGMGIPLLVIGATHGHVLPKTGHWMVTVERLTGVIMLGFAIWMLSRIIPGPVTLLLWGFLLMGVAVFLSHFFRGLSERHHVRRSIGLIIFMYGIILLVGAVLGNSDPLQPFENVKPVIHQKNTGWVIVKNNAEFEQALHEAKQKKQLVMLDFYADWCIACIEMDKKVFAKREVQQALSGMMLLRANVTDNNAFDQALMQQYDVIAPPTYVFFAADGAELTANRIVGETNKNDFLAALTLIKNKESKRAD